jgi:nucleoside recognition membrane protein YjiH
MINGVWNLIIKRFSFKFIPPNNIYSSIKAYVGKVLVVLDTIHSFRGGGVFLTLYIPIQVRVLLAIMLNKHIYIHV